MSERKIVLEMLLNIKLLLSLVMYLINIHSHVLRKQLEEGTSEKKKKACQGYSDVLHWIGIGLNN